jgi:hypothetical protein
MSKMILCNVQDVQHVLDTLPIAYYLKIKTLSVELSETAETSFIDLATQKVTIAMNNLTAIASKHNGYLTESNVRGLLYHELSHALRTPLRVSDFFTYKRLVDHEVFNILEDERIETLGQGTFLDTDFKANLKEIVDYNPHPTTWREYLFNVARFRQTGGHPELITLLLKVIRATAEINALAESTKLSGLLELFYVFAKTVKTTFEQDRKNINQQLKKAQPDTPEQTSAEAKSIEDEIDQEKNEQLEKVCEEWRDQLLKTALYAGKGGLELYDPNTKLYVDFVRIISKQKGFGNASTPSMSGYHGKFDPRLRMKDFSGEKKYWRHSTNNGDQSHQKQKLTLNIFLDNSFSFVKNDYAVNIILATLKSLEQKRDDFKFNLVKIDAEQGGIHLLQGDSRVSVSTSYTSFTEEALAKVAKQIVTPETFNIVLFDGSIGTDCWEIIAKYLDSYKTSIIAENSNKNDIDKCISKSRVMYENRNYASALSNNVCTAIECLF